MPSPRPQSKRRWPQAPGRRHGLLRPGVLRRRDRDAESGPAGGRTACGSRSSTTRPAAGRRASRILTGYYPQQIRMDPPRGRLPAWASLLPHHPAAAGLPLLPRGQVARDRRAKPVADGGFDRSYWFEDWDRYFSPASTFEDDVQLPPVAPDSGYYATTAFADHAIGCLKDHARTARGQAVLPVPGLHLAALSAARLAGGHRPVSRPVPGGLGRRSAQRAGSGCARWASSTATWSAAGHRSCTPRYFKPELLDNGRSGRNRARRSRGTN